MTPERFQQAMQLFTQLCDRPESSRTPELDRLCGDDAELRRQVEGLLNEDASAARLRRVDVLAEAPLRVAGTLDGPAVGRDISPDWLGRYRVIRRLGEGGMGTVYEAEQESPRRTVAIKVLRPDAASAGLQKRFEHEAHILGHLSHPGIAQIIEAGRDVGSTGERLFLVMELIRGRDLISYADGQQLDPRQRLELFIRVCEAVQHAHQKGVIHRDLKPANILVVEESSRYQPISDSRAAAIGQPKILDFGVARLIDSDAALTAVHTHFGQWIGTLSYMSPEQVSGDPDEVDTRSDVYALGVLLYELLTGRLPYDVRNRSYFDAARTIREEVPQRLSTLGRMFRGDLETIAGKALEKDKTRRYQSAAELCADVQAFLRGDPIAAKRDSRWYVAHKAVRRYKLAVALVASLLVVSAAATVALALLYRDAGAARLQAEQAEAAAVRQAEQARRTLGVLREVVRSANSRALGREARVVDALAHVAEQSRTRLREDPASAADIEMVLGQTYCDLGFYPEALAALEESERLYRQTSPGGSAELADTLNHKGAVLAEMSRWDEAIAALREAQLLHRQFAPHDLADLAWDLANLGTILQRSERLDEAESLLRESLRIRRELPATGKRYWVEIAESLNGLAGLLYKRADFDAAASAAEEAISIYEQHVAGVLPSGYASSLNNLGAIELRRGSHDRTRQLYTAALKAIETLRGPDHAEVAYALVNLADFERNHGDVQRAEPLFRRCLEIRRRVNQPGHPELGYPLTGLGDVLLSLGRADEAAPLLREAWELRTRLSPEAFTTGLTTSALGRCLLAQGRLADAEPLLLDAYRLIESGGPQHRAVQKVVQALVTLYTQTGQAEPRAAWQARLNATAAGS